MPQTHAQLTAAIRQLGERMGDRLASDLVADPLAPQTLAWAGRVDGALGATVSATHTQAIMVRLRNALAGTAVPAFSTWYRNLVSNTDEHLSTSSMRELYDGFVMGTRARLLNEPQPIQQTVTDRLVSIGTDAFSAISMMRLPTRMTGQSSTATGTRFQHPLGPNADPFWGAIVKGDGSSALHSKLDLERRNHVLEKMEAEFAATQDFGSTCWRGLVAATQFTVNRFAAPASASNMNPYGVDTSEWAAQVAQREALKNVLVQLGAPQEAQDATIDNYGRQWNEDRAADDPLSPGRADQEADSFDLDDVSMSESFSDADLQVDLMETGPPQPLLGFDADDLDAYDGYDAFHFDAYDHMDVDQNPGPYDAYDAYDAYDQYDFEALMAQAPPAPTNDPVDIDALLAQAPDVPLHDPFLDSAGGGSEAMELAELVLL